MKQDLSSICVKLYCNSTEGTKDLKFDCIRLNLVHGFITIWYSLTQADYENYLDHYLHYDYMKLLDKNQVLLYSGVMLDKDELKHKIKHLSRIDLPMNKETKNK